MDRKADDVMDWKIVRDLKTLATAENREVLKRFESSLQMLSKNAT